MYRVDSEIEVNPGTGFLQFGIASDFLTSNRRGVEFRWGTKALTPALSIKSTVIQ